MMPFAFKSTSIDALLSYRFCHQPCDYCGYLGRLKKTFHLDYSYYKTGEIQEIDVKMLQISENWENTSSDKGKTR